MEIEKLTKSIVKPYFTNNIIVRMITSYIFIEHDFNNSINVNIKLMLSPKESTLNDVNIFELIQWINSFDHIKVLHWDDDKEFDFSNIENITLILKFDYKKYFIEFNNYDQIKLNNLDSSIKKLIELNQSDQLSKLFNDIFYNFSKENNMF
jgi:hypothetical protein